jgi:hypothetical protein
MAAAPTPPPVPPLDPDLKRKKPLPFQRKTVVEGQLRTFKVQMLPTPAQTHELKRAFSAARRAYNWALDRVKNHDEKPNAIALRNAFRKEPPPHWASGKQAVASRILAGAVKQVADAYASNFAKKKKDPTYNHTHSRAGVSLAYDRRSVRGVTHMVLSECTHHAASAAAAAGGPVATTCKVAG